MLLGTNATITFKRHKKTGTANQSTPTSTLVTNVPCSIQPVRGDNPIAFDGPPGGSLFYIFIETKNVPTELWIGDVGTDNKSRVYTVTGVEDWIDHHLKLVARRTINQTIVAAS